MSLSKLPADVLFERILPTLHQRDLYNLGMTSKNWYRLCFYHHKWPRVDVRITRDEEFAGFGDFLRNGSVRNIRELNIMLDVGEYNVGLVPVRLPGVNRLKIDVDCASTMFNLARLMSDVYLMMPNVSCFTLSAPDWTDFDHNVLPRSPWSLSSLSVDIPENSFSFPMFNSFLHSSFELHHFSYNASHFPCQDLFFDAYSSTLRSIEILDVTFRYGKYLPRCNRLKSVVIVEQHYLTRPDATELPPNITDLAFRTPALDRSIGGLIAPTVRRFSFEATDTDEDFRLEDRRSLFLEVRDMFPSLKVLSMKLSSQNLFDTDAAALGELRALQEVTLVDVQALTGCFLIANSGGFPRLRQVTFKSCRHLVERACILGCAEIKSLQKIVIDDCFENQNEIIQLA